ncbi:putative PTS IIA-like nitrogen-regulatory protein PtsN [Photobacterium gaetbulicola Gung47]|uniref:Putative PTS IIA-like nitrogen-regulatory protein PtsN n=2 Tax=Photobacterium gaetbulicola TaxID=1295392 RepID=A0A0C5W4F8_9GAMM|nr:putative PTS IIA-like nitrogen-regulatory protein PtsN [Photobacterium gaetbulicola Gung47]
MVALSQILVALSDSATKCDFDRFIYPVRSLKWPQRHKLPIEETRRAMLKELLTQDVISLHDSAENWQQAIELACQPLIDNGAIEPSYVEAIFKSHQEMGPYYVIGPGIAMPHARPENGVNRLALGLTVIRNGVNFDADENDPVKMLVTLAATDSNSHVDAIAQLAELFMNEEHVAQICAAQDVAAIRRIIETY